MLWALLGLLLLPPALMFPEATMIACAVVGGIAIVTRML
jgi:hypothetical protein